MTCKLGFDAGYVSLQKLAFQTIASSGGGDYDVGSTRRMAGIHAATLLCLSMSSASQSCGAMSNGPCAMSRGARMKEP
jgi:hypothetical protein